MKKWQNLQTHFYTSLPFTRKKPKAVQREELPPLNSSIMFLKTSKITDLIVDLLCIFFTTGLCLLTEIRPVIEPWVTATVNMNLPSHQMQPIFLCPIKAEPAFQLLWTFCSANSYSAYAVRLYSSVNEAEWEPPLCCEWSCLHLWQ